MPTVAKKPKPKTQQQIQELHDLIAWKLAQPRRCDCGDCLLTRALYCSIEDALNWALGNNSEDFDTLVRNLKRSHDLQTKHHRAYAE